MNICKTWNKINENLSFCFHVSTMSSDNAAMWDSGFDTLWNLSVVLLISNLDERTYRNVIWWNGMKKFLSVFPQSECDISLWSLFSVVFFVVNPFQIRSILIHFHFIDSRLKLKFFFVFPQKLISTFASCDTK